MNTWLARMWKKQTSQNQIKISSIISVWSRAPWEDFKGPNRSLALNLTYELRRRLAGLEHGISVRGATAKILIEMANQLPQLKDVPTLLPYFEKLNNFVGSYGDAFYDIHAANLMQRSDGTIVFQIQLAQLIFTLPGMANLNRSLAFRTWSGPTSKTDTVKSSKRLLIKSNPISKHWMPNFDWNNK